MAWIGTILSFTKSLFSFLTPIISYFTGRRQGVIETEKEVLENNEELRKKMEDVDRPDSKSVSNSLQDGDF